VLSDSSDTGPPDRVARRVQVAQPNGHSLDGEAGPRTEAENDVRCYTRSDSPWSIVFRPQSLHTAETEQVDRHLVPTVNRQQFFDALIVVGSDRAGTQAD